MSEVSEVFAKSEAAAKKLEAAAKKGAWIGGRVRRGGVEKARRALADR